MFWKNLPTTFRATLGRAAFLATHLAAVACATPSLALTCLQMGPGDVYRIVAEEEVEYVVLEGKVDFDTSQMPSAEDQPTGGASADPQRIPALFQGLMLGERSFDQPLNGAIQLEVHCAGGWCGGLDTGGRYLMFARQEENALVVPLDPCVSFVFPATDGMAGDIVLQCHRGGICQSDLPTELPPEVAPD